MPRGPVRLLILLMFVLLPGLPLQAVQATRFTHISVEHGLSQNTVQAIVQDHVGFLWFATEEGLNRYDGYTLVVFKHNPREPNSLPDNRVSALHEDKEQRFWVGTSTGLSLFDRRTETFTRVPEIRERVTCFHEDADGTLWIGTEGDGFYERDPHTGSFTVHKPQVGDPDSLSSWVVTSILRDRSGYLWVGTRYGGIDRMDKEGNRFIHHRHDPADPRSLTHDEIWSLAEDRDGNLWIATYGGGLSIYDPKTQDFQNYGERPNDPASLPTNLLTSVLVDQTGNVWVGTDGAGILKYENGSRHFSLIVHDPSDASSLSPSAIRTIYEDNQGQVWVGTNLGGADLLKKPRHDFSYFTHSATDPTSLSDPTVSAFLEDTDGRVWVGMEGGWLDLFDQKTGSFIGHRIPSNVPGGSAILSLLQDTKGRIWVGSYHGGLAHFDPKTGTFTTFVHKDGDPQSIGDDDVWAIAEDRDGMLWLGTNIGLDRFDPNRGIVTVHYGSDPNDLSHEDTRALICDHEGNIWIGTLGGLNCLRHSDGKFLHFLHDDSNLNSLSHDGVVAIHEDRKGRLWIGTHGGGLNLMNVAAGTFTTYDSFPSSVIYRIEEDDSGRLWVGTNNGLARFDPQIGAIESFGLSNGLQSLEFHLGASLRMRDGQMLFGGVDGFYQFDPAAILPEGYAPPVVLTSVRVMNQPAQRGVFTRSDEITLQHDDKVLSLEFAALEYTFPRRNRYAYLMEGFSDHWLYLDDKREVTFTNLDPGHYVFRAKATNNDGIWNDASTFSLDIIVRPPFWATWWFRGLSVGILGLFLIIIPRFRIRRLTAEISERKRAESAIRRAEEVYRELVEDIDDIIFATDESGRVNYISPVIEPTLGYKPAEIVGQSIEILIAPEERTSVMTSLRKGMQERFLEPFEFRVLAKNGKIRWMSVSSRSIFHEGKVSGLRGVLTDITERKKLESQLHQSQKMEAIGQLAGGVAHDFNNLMTVIISYCEVMLKDKGITVRIRSFVTEARDAGQRAATLTRQLLAFSRQQVLQPRVLELNDLISGMKLMLQRLIGEDVHLELSLDPGLGCVMADPIQIEQVMMNMAVNSRDAMPRGGKLVVEVTSTVLDEHFTREIIGLRPGPYVRLSVSDTGCGMDAETQAHMFEPFFTTKEVGRGTGLGLSTVYGIVKQSNGHIVMESQVGVGTVFKIYLPRVEKPKEVAVVLAEDGELPRGTETILLVEDDDQVRKISREILTEHGYTVLEASNGERAIKVREQYSGEVHLVLTDVIMPVMGGRELVEHLTGVYPRTAVLFMSGYTDDAVLRHGVIKTGLALLEKPFTPAMLTRRIRGVLDGLPKGFASQP